MNEHFAWLFPPETDVEHFQIGSQLQALGVSAGWCYQLLHCAQE